MFIVALLIIAKKWKHPKYSSIGGKVVYPYNGLLFSHKREVKKPDTKTP